MGSRVTWCQANQLEPGLIVWVSNNCPLTNTLIENEFEDSGPPSSRMTLVSNTLRVGVNWSGDRSHRVCVDGTVASNNEALEFKSDPWQSSKCILASISEKG